MTVSQLLDELQKGGRFVVYPYAMSFGLVTVRRFPVLFVRAGQNRVVEGLESFFLSLLQGWWCFPWGLVFTPIYLVADLCGGRDVTNEIAQPLIEHRMLSAGRHRWEAEILRREVERQRVEHLDQRGKRKKEPAKAAH
jgi:hypothetical protein